MPDTIEDRAAVIRMRRRAAGESVQPYRVRRDGPALAGVRNRLHEWLTAHVDELTDAMPAMPLEDRAADTWEPLIAVADLAGGTWPADARQAALTLLAEQEDSAELPLSVRLLADCRTAFRDADALPTADLLQRLLADEEAPWATLGSGGLSPMKLGMLLRDFEIRSGNIRFPTGQAKGYHRSAFTDAWNRYCPEPETTDDTGTAQAVPPAQAVPHLTCEGTPGTAGTASPQQPGQAVCIRCRQPMSYDDGTHAHPTCETARGAIR